MASGCQKALPIFASAIPQIFSLAEWQQSKRIGRDPNMMKALVRECWAMTASKEAFSEALERRGLALARGDRRDYVVVAYDGTVRAIPRLIGKRVKEVAARLGETEELSSVALAREQIAAKVAPRLRQLTDIADTARAKKMAPLYERRINMRKEHASERQRLDEGQEHRSVAETRHRSARFRAGMVALWDRLSGQHSRIVRQNEMEAYAAFKRDRAQGDHLVADQLKDWRVLQHEIMAVRHRHAARVTELYRDIAERNKGSAASRHDLRDRFSDTARLNQSDDGSRSIAGRRSHASANKPRGPELG